MHVEGQHTEVAAILSSLEKISDYISGSNAHSYKRQDQKRSCDGGSFNGCCEREWLDFGLCRNNRNAKMLNGCIYMKGKDRGGVPTLLPQCLNAVKLKE